MQKSWVLLGGVTFVASLIVVVPFLPERAKEIMRPSYFVEVSEDNLSVLFVGDIMLDRGVAVHALAFGDEALFKGVVELFSNSDIVVGNLEGTITSQASIAQVDNSILRFTFDPRLTGVLARAGVSATSLANNHALDFGHDGYDETIANLEYSGISAFGSPFNNEHIAVQSTIGDQTLCLVGYHSLFGGGIEPVIEKLQSIRGTCDHVVVVAHWGAEYRHEPEAEQIEAAHEFVDAGADVVIGAHPHVVQPLEIYKNRAIFYSLGNFLFDQGFSSQVKRGLAVEVTFGPLATRFTLVPVNTFKEVSVADEKTAQAVFSDLGVTKNTFELVR